MVRSNGREDMLIQLLLSGKSQTEIAKQMHLTRVSIWRMRQKSSFQERYQWARAQAFDAAVSVLHSSATTFAETLTKVCLDKKARGSEKATAARSGLDSLFNAKKLFDFDERLRKLESVAEAEGTTTMQIGRD